MYHMTELTVTLADSDTAADEGVGGQGEVVPGMLGKAVTMLATLTKKKKEQAEQVKYDNRMDKHGLNFYRG